MELKATPTLEALQLLSRQDLMKACKGYGAEYSIKDTKDIMLAKICAKLGLDGGPEIAPAVQAAAPVAKAKKSKFEGQKMFRVVVNSMGPGDDQDVMLGIVNLDANWIIQRDKEVVIPECALDLLRNAKVETKRYDEKTNTWYPYSHRRYSFTAEAV